MGEIRVLILDDHALVRELLASRLSQQPDFEVIGLTGDPDEAVELARRLQPDMTLVDVRGLDDGPGCCQRLAHASPDSRLVVLTSYLIEGEEQLLQKLGAAACLVKADGLKGPLAELRKIMGVQSPSKTTG